MFKKRSCHWVPGRHLSGSRVGPGGSAATRGTDAAPAPRPHSGRRRRHASVLPAPDVAQQRALVDQYCVTCHNAKLKTANLLLDQLDLAHLGDHAEIGGKSRAEAARRA